MLAAAAWRSGSGNVVANHAGTVFGVAPGGDVFLRTKMTTLDRNEIETVCRRPPPYTPYSNLIPRTYYPMESYSTPILYHTTFQLPTIQPHTTFECTCTGGAQGRPARGELLARLEPAAGQRHHDTAGPALSLWCQGPVHFVLSS